MEARESLTRYGNIMVLGDGDGVWFNLYEMCRLIGLKASNDETQEACEDLIELSDLALGDIYYKSNEHPLR